MLNYGNSENFRSFGRQIDTDIFFFNSTGELTS